MQTLVLEIDSLQSFDSGHPFFPSHVTSSPCDKGTVVCGDVFLSLKDVIARPGLNGTTSQIIVFTIEFGLGFAASVAATWFVKWLKEHFTLERDVDQKEIEELLVYLSKGSDNNGTIAIRKKRVVVTRTTQKK